MNAWETTSLQDTVIRAAAGDASRGIHVYDRRGKTAERRTHRELLDLARHRAAALAKHGLEPKDRVLVALPTSWSALEVWFGALFRGAWPVMLAPGGAMGAVATQAQRIEELCERLDAKKFVCDANFRDELAHAGAQRASASAVTPEELAATSVTAALPDPQPAPDDMAFLQLTSGSTGRQRAVMISHRGAVHNPIAIEDAVSAPHGSLAREWNRGVVSWLPLYHDMGLVGCLLFSIAHRFDLWLLRPETFLTRPKLWLEAVGRNGPNLSPAPNFAFQLCAERVKASELEGADLSHWAASLCGAEMIRPETMVAFCSAFASKGYRTSSLRPCYGLAEGTLDVTCVRQGGVRTQPLPAGADSGFGLTEVVSTGSAIRDMEVRITTPSGEPLPEGKIGQIRAKGPSIFLGYFNDPEATREGLQDGWLCTGDLGFLHRGELYITGRTKDLLIIHGHNFMPHEMEWLAESVSGSGGTERSAAFSVAKGTEGEQAILVMEIAEREGAALKDLEHEVRLCIAREMKLPLAEVVFVRRGQIPKTTSGKVQRGELRQRYLDGKLERLG